MDADSHHIPKQQFVPLRLQLDLPIYVELHLRGCIIGKSLILCYEHA